MSRIPFSYLIENEVCYLVLCDKLFSKRIAFNFLEDLAQEFHTNYGRKVNTVTRPYQFIEFDIYIQKAKKSLTDRRRNINTINNQLQDVQRIMVQNIDDVLQRGAVLSELDTKTQNLSLLSQKYKKSATQLNRRSMYVKAAIGGIILLVLGMYFWVFWDAASVFVQCLHFIYFYAGSKSVGGRIIKSKFMKHLYWRRPLEFVSLRTIDFKGVHEIVKRETNAQFHESPRFYLMKLGKEKKSYKYRCWLWQYVVRHYFLPLASSSFFSFRSRCLAASSRCCRTIANLARSDFACSVFPCACSRW